MSNVVYLITGANRPDGIGFAAVQTLLKDPRNHIIAAVRDPKAAVELNALAGTVEGRLALVEMDAAKLDTIKASFETVAGLPFVRDHGIDVLWANAGVSLHSDVPVTQLDAQDAMTSFQINTLGPIFLVQAFLPLLRLGKQKKIFYTSSALASTELAVTIGDPNAQYPSYGSSKAAANHLFKRLHNELSAPEGFTVVCLHPGLVATGFTKKEGVVAGKTYGTAVALSAQESGDKIATLIVDAQVEHSGKLYYESLKQPIPW